MKGYSTPLRRSPARGLVLPTVLIMLLILSVAAVVLAEQISSQTRMAGNSANMDTTLQAAEATLRDGANALINGNVTEAQLRGNAAGLYYFNAANYNASTPVPWQSATAWAAVAADTVAWSGSSKIQRKYMIEELPPVVSPGGSTQKAYRITAQAIGLDGKTVVMLQTLYKI
jgi:Tfp pilus assembly protein PilX